MQTWRDSMPAGMKLKSEGFASNLSDPKGALPLGTFCGEENIPYADTNLPVSLDTFVAYGEAFQKRFVPDLEQKMVELVEPAPHGFDLRLEGGEVVAARRTVIASGIRAFAYYPPELIGLPKEVLSHSADFGDAAHLAGREVVVIGAGASAMDVAALLRSRGAHVTIVTRRSAIRFQTPLGERKLHEKIRAPMTGLGPGWKSVLCVRGPLLFHAMPKSFRVDVVRRYLGPAPAWFAREQVEGHVPYILLSNVVEARATDAGVRLTLRHADGSSRQILADHVVAATGYRVDTRKLTFLGDRIQAGLGRVAGAPALSRDFESTMPGLYFVGTSAANSFGPMLRFVHGTKFTSRRVAGHIARAARKSSASDGPPLGGDFSRAHLTIAKDNAFGQPAGADGQLNERIRYCMDGAWETDSFSAAPDVRMLFIALSNDVGSERIIAGMARSGVECAVMSPSNYFCASTRAVKRHFFIPGQHGVALGTLFVRSRLEDAVREWRPRLILPLDDISAWILRSLAIDPKASPALRDVLVESLGAPEGYSAAVSRQAFMDAAARLGVHKPAHCEVTNVEVALATAESWGYPIVIKSEFTCGGRGVAIARDATELAAQLQSRSTAVWPRRLKLLAKQSLYYLSGFGAGPVPGAVLQSFVPGSPAFRTLAAWKGRVIAGVSFVAEQTDPAPVGASTVVRHIENDEMECAAATMTAALGCSGFVSFDFMLDQKTGRAALIEMNPRSVSSTHLGAIFGHDICGAFAAKLSGAPPPAPQPAQTTAAVALFPKELERDPDSPYLQFPDFIHDVPKEDPVLLEAYLRRLAALHPILAKDIEVALSDLLCAK